MDPASGIGIPVAFAAGLVSFLSPCVLPLVPRLAREWHVGKLMERAGRGGPVLTGAAFALAWTPCTGPTLGAIITATGGSKSAAHGALLLTIYCAGLGIPFLLTGLAFG